MSTNVLKLAIEARFKPSLTFFGKQGEIGNQIWEKVYPNWETDGKRIVFKDMENKEICVIEYRRLLVIKENLGEFKIEAFPSKRFSSVFKSYCETLTETKLLRLGFRIIGYYDCKMKFKEITSIMQPKVYPDERSELYKITNSNFDDIAFAVIYKKNNKSIRFQCGPVTNEELLARAQLGFPVDNSILPEASLFFDIDVFKEKPAEAGVDNFIAEAAEMLEKDIKEFINYIFK